MTATDGDYLLLRMKQAFVAADPELNRIINDTNELCLMSEYVQASGLDEIVSERPPSPGLYDAYKKEQAKAPGSASQLSRILNPPPVVIHTASLVGGNFAESEAPEAPANTDTESLRSRESSLFEVNQGTVKGRPRAAAPGVVSPFGELALEDAADTTDDDTGQQLAVPQLHKSSSTSHVAPPLAFVSRAPRAPPPAKSGLSLLLDRAAQANAHVNPFARLYVGFIEAAQEGAKEGADDAAATGAATAAATAATAAAATGPINPAIKIKLAPTVRRRNYARKAQTSTTRLFFPDAAPGHALPVKLKPETTVDEAIGVGLYLYVEEKLEPRLEVEDADIETTKWSMRVAEDSGAVDEDFPALDRTRPMNNFTFENFAIVRASSKQAAENLARLREKTTPAPISAEATPIPADTTPTRARHAAHTAEVNAVKLPIQVLLPDTTIVDLKVSTTLTYRDIVNHLCSRHQLGNPIDFALYDDTLLVPLETTVSPSTPFLRLARKTDLALPPSLVTQQFSVVRKRLAVGRQPRIIAIDGDYIHFMPEEHGSGKTTSFHITNIVECELSRRLPNAFHITATKNDRVPKRYDFEAASAKVANTIVKLIQNKRNDFM